MAVLNLMGRVFMADYDCPFRKADQLLQELPKDVTHVIVDFHAEATSEKIAFAVFGRRVSAVLGTIPMWPQPINRFCRRERPMLRT